jgi:superfamily II DNA or RNA helicase
MSDWAAGTEVRLVHDPGTVGFCTGKSRPRGSALWVEVAFPGLGKTFQAEYELEVVADSEDDPYGLIQQGRYGSAEHLRRGLTHIQLSGRLANLVYSMETTNTDYYAYQYKPVIAFLESPSNGLLIADEVGLGKTIEAGLIWTELRARFDCRRLVVICPAMLREKWKIELARRFGVNAEILGVKDFLQAVQQPKHRTPDGRAIIGSFQGLRPPRGWGRPDEEGAPRRSLRRDLARFLHEAADGEPVIDLLVVDEAHYLRNRESLTSQIGQLLREVSEHAVFLSATPINLSNDDLFTLLNLLDPDTFAFREFFSDLLGRNAPLVKAREMALRLDSTEEDIKQLLKEALLLATRRGESTERNRSLTTLLNMPMPAAYLAETANRVKLANHLERINLLAHVVSRTRKAEVTEFRAVRRARTRSVTMTEAEDLLYRQVTDSVRRYAWANNLSDGFLLAAPQRQVSSCMAAAVRSWRSREANPAEMLYEDMGAEQDGEGVSPLIESLLDEVVPGVDLEELELNDSKYECLSGIFEKLFEDEPDAKVILFSYFRGTLRYLHERLHRDGVKAEILMGGMKESKQSVIDRFRENPETRVLLSSEVAAEGIDLQFSRTVVNYDLPWNPMKVEQRIGRIDRIGQESDILLIWNLCYEGTIDQRIVDRLYQRLRVFERALGGFEVVLGEKIQELTTELLSWQLTPEEEAARIDQTAIAIQNIREQQEQLEAQAGTLIAHGGYILDQVHAAREFSRRITDQDLFVYVREYLDRHAPGHTLQQVADTPPEYEIQLPANIAGRLGEFIRDRHLAGWTQLATGDLCRCRFVNKVQFRSGRTEQVSQLHPLIRFISDDLAQLKENFFPLVAVRVQQAACAGLVGPGHYGFAVHRWYFSGLRTEEEIRARVVPLSGEEVLDEETSLNLINQTRVLGSDWLGAGSILDPEQVTGATVVASDRLEADFQESAQIKDDENFDRVAFQQDSLGHHRDRRLDRLQQVYLQHELNGRKALVAATLGKMEKLKQRTDTQLEALAQRSQLNRNRIEVCMGALEVY